MKQLYIGHILFSRKFELGFLFAKLFRNFSKRKRKVLLLLRYIFARKIALCAIIRKLHFAQKLRYSLLHYTGLRNFVEQILIKGWIKVNCNAYKGTDYLPKTLFCQLLILNLRKEQNCSIFKMPIKSISELAR